MSSLVTRLVSPLAVVLALSLAAALPVSAHPRAQFPVQSSGDRGADVVALQHLLRARGRSVSVSGFFGTETRGALQAFQTQVGLGSTGVANVATWEALVPNLSQGSTGEAVLALKKELNAKHKAGLGLGSSFDAATRDAVRSFQAHIGLSANGVVDKTTWRNLVWHYMRPDFSRASLCNYNGGSTRADWGTASAVAHLASAADLFRSRAAGVVAIGDISFEHGGDINLHQTHEDGLDIDIALIRLDGRQCSNPGISYTSGQYDRADTRRLLQAIRDSLGGHLKLIYFNDPQMINERLSQRFANHDDHIHVRLCEPSHAKAIYTC
jgi:hypothetical protein